MLVVAVAAAGIAVTAGHARASAKAPTSGSQLIAATLSQGSSLKTYLVLYRPGENHVQAIEPSSQAHQLANYDMTWSPDGRLIAYACNGKGIDDDQHSAICAVDVKTGRTRVIAHPPTLYLTPIAWGENGKILSGCRAGKRRLEDAVDICFVDATSGAVTFVTKSGSAPSDGYIFSDAAWSPDNTTVAFTCRKQTQTDRRFCVIGKDGRLNMQASSWNTAYVEGWTPDSKRIVWWGRFSGSDRLAYHEQNADGSGLKPLPSAAVVLGPHYTANGRTRIRDAGVDLEEEPVAGGKVRTLIDGGVSKLLIWEYAFRPRR
jgi:Tol biopolymer transport system component